MKRTNKQIMIEITDKIIENLSENICNAYKDDIDIFIDIADNWIKPSLDNAKKKYLDYISRQYLSIRVGNQITKLKQQLANWREERHLSTESQKQNLLSNVLEELTELARAKDDLERIDAYCDIIVFCMNAIELNEIISIVNYRINTDVKSFAENTVSQINRGALETTINDCVIAIEQLGYEPFECMQETIKEISSRTGHYDESIGKFVKDLGFYTLSECQETYPNYKVTEETNRFKIDLGDEIQYKPKWYKADYSKCKIEG